MATDTFSNETKHKYENSPLWKPWMEKFRLRQIESEAQLEEFLEQNESVPYVSWDIETSSLDNKPENVCGHCISFNSSEAVYVPTQHVNYSSQNLNHERVWKIIDKSFKSKVVLVYNWMFEGRTARLRGWERTSDLAEVKDVMIYRWLYDSDKRQFNLKDAAEELLGYKMLEIHEVPAVKLGKGRGNINFSMSDPEDATLYAAADPLFTLMIYEKIGKKVEQEQNLILKIEHSLLDVLLDMESNPITIDRAYLSQAKKDLTHWINITKKEIFRMAGKEFNVDSTKETGQVLVDMKVPIRVNEKGNTMTGADEIEKLSREYPICSSILFYRSLVKERSTYVEALLNCTSPDRPKAVFKFRSVGAPTGRFASGGVDEGDPIYAPMNVQCLSLDTLVATQKGMVAIKDLPQGGMVWDGQSFQEYQGPFFDKKKLVEITLENGISLKASKDHLIYSCSSQIGFEKVENLREGDWVAVNSSGITYNDIPNRVTGKTKIGSSEVELDCSEEIFWEIYGLALGDGCLKRENREDFMLERGMVFNFGWNEDTEYAYVKNILDKIGYKVREGENKKEGYKPTKTLTNDSQAGSRVFTKWGFSAGARNKEIPEAIHSASVESRKALIRGLLSSDGCDNSSIRLKSTSLSLLEGVQSILISLGFLSSINGSEEKAYTLNVWDKFRFIKEINFIPGKKRTLVESQTTNESMSKRKLERIPLLIWEKYREKKGRRQTRRNLSVLKEIHPGEFDLNVYWLKIKSMKNGPIRAVADLYIPSTNRFMANGIIVHNSIPSSSSYQSTLVYRIKSKIPDLPGEFESE